MVVTHPPQSTPRNPEFNFHAGQIRLLRSYARVTVVSAGTGGGKTSSGYYWLLSRMRLWPNESWLIGFPNYPLQQKVLFERPDPNRETLMDFLRRQGEHPSLRVKGGVIECRSGKIFFASAKALVGWVGSHVKGVWIDEFDDTSRDALRMAMERTRLREGYVLLTGTPRNVRWVKEEVYNPWKGEGRVEQGEPPSGDVWDPDRGLTGRYSVIMFASTDNPTYNAAMLAEAEATLPRWYVRRMYYGELAAMEGGNTVHREWWRFFDADSPPTPSEVVQFWDTAFKDKSQNDYSVCATWGRVGNDLAIFDVWRDKVEFPDLVPKARQLYEARGARLCVVEDKASGPSLAQSLRRYTRMNVQLWPIGTQDKLSRLVPYLPVISSGRVWLPDNAPWVHDFVEEHAAFPDKEEHDDQVDTTSMALAYWERNDVGPLPEQEPIRAGHNPAHFETAQRGPDEDPSLAGLVGEGEFGPYESSRWDL